MSALAPTLQAFFSERLLSQCRASPHTIASYRDAFCLLLRFIEREVGKPPARLRLQDLDASRIGAFLDHLEHVRRNSVRTRNARLAAIHSLFRFAALRHPEHAALIERVLAIPPKRFERQVVTFLTDKEVEALLAAPDRSSFLGRRDHALLLVAIQTGLRVSEIIGLKRQDVVLGAGAHVRCVGKGRKERVTPLTSSTAALLKAWLGELGGESADPLFPTRQGVPLSRYGVTVLVARHARSATTNCPSLATKKVSPHVLRHTAAMRLLHAGIDTSVIALWLGHEGVETTQIYVHADLSIKERALARTTPIAIPPGRYRPPDQLLAFLEGL
ncbi:MAG: tyrosine-type recombinase/integrase [Deinococcales bacterium]|jgi:integrase/recombinase XerD